MKDQFTIRVEDEESIQLTALPGWECMKILIYTARKRDGLATMVTATQWEKIKRAGDKCFAYRKGMT